MIDEDPYGVEAKVYEPDFWRQGGRPMPPTAADAPPHLPPAEKHRPPPDEPLPVHLHKQTTPGPAGITWVQYACGLSYHHPAKTIPLIQGSTRPGKTTCPMCQRYGKRNLAEIAKRTDHNAFGPWGDYDDPKAEVSQEVAYSRSRKFERRHALPDEWITVTPTRRAEIASLLAKRNPIVAAIAALHGKAGRKAAADRRDLSIRLAAINVAIRNLQRRPNEKGRRRKPKTPH